LDVQHSVSAAGLAPDQLVDPAWAGAFLKTKESTLAVWRSTGRYDLPFVKVGRKVCYRVGDLVAFVESRTVSHTGQPLKA
jgi:hypothetical protein